MKVHWQPERRVDVDKIFNQFRVWIAAMRARPVQPDPLEAMSLRERADLPPSHPLADCG
jgi:hypothetical protein